MEAALENQRRGEGIEAELAIPIRDTQADRVRTILSLTVVRRYRTAVGMPDAPGPARSLPAPASAAGALVRVPAAEAEDMRLFLDNLRADLGSARASCATVARLFPAWAPAMARLTAEIAALDAEAALYVALAQAALAPAPGAGLPAFEAAGAGGRAAETP